VAKVTLGAPGLLRECVGGQFRAPLEATTPSQAIAGMIADYPRLKVHVFDEAGAVRAHVFLALNGRKLRDGDLDIRLRDGDRLDVVQAVSGG